MNDCLTILKLSYVYVVSIFLLKMNLVLKAICFKPIGYQWMLSFVFQDPNNYKPYSLAQLEIIAVEISALREATICSAYNEICINM